MYEQRGGVREVTEGSLHLSDGTTLTFDECLWCTYARCALGLLPSPIPALALLPALFVAPLLMWDLPGLYFHSSHAAPRHGWLRAASRWTQVGVEGKDPGWLGLKPIHLTPFTNFLHP